MIKRAVHKKTPKNMTYNIEVATIISPINGSLRKDTIRMVNRRLYLFSANLIKSSSFMVLGYIESQAFIRSKIAEAEGETSEL
jgi:hypothetical protein